MSLDERETLIEWLLVNGGPVVRFRTAVELCVDLPRMEVERLARELLACPQAQHWLGHLTLGGLANELDHLDAAGLARLAGLVHGSKPGALENVLGRLNEHGLRAGMAPFDQAMLPLMRIYRWRGSSQSGALYQTAWESLVKSIFAWGLLRARYIPDPAMQDYLLAHIDLLHQAARDQVYEIYAGEEERKGLPKAWAGKPILKQEVMANYHLPLIHDLYLLAYLPAWLVDEAAACKIADVVAYVLDPRFQSFENGFGYAWIKERRTCYSWGWSPHLAGFAGHDWRSESAARPLVQQLELMARFPQARQSSWFQAGVRHLEWFRTPADTYCFPAHYLCDQPDGYYVTGTAMGLGENRRTRRGLEIESTFRMIKIRSSADSCFGPVLL